MRKRVYARAIGRYTIELEGSGIYDACETLGVPKMRPIKGGALWWIPQSRCEDVLALLEHRGFAVVVTL